MAVVGNPYGGLYLHHTWTFTSITPLGAVPTGPYVL